MPLIESLKKYLSSNYYVPTTVPGTGDVKVNKKSPLTSRNSRIGEKASAK